MSRSQNKKVVEKEAEEKEESVQTSGASVPEVKLPELEVILPSEPTAVLTEQVQTQPSPAPTPAPVSAPVQALPPQPTPSKSELVKIYILKMRLPSEYLVQQVTYTKTSSGGIAEQRVWEGLAKAVASRLRGIRREVYDMLKELGSFGYVEDYGFWIAVSDKAVKDAEAVSKWVREELNKLPLKKLRPDIDVDRLYSVEAIPVYLEPEKAKELLRSAIARYEEAYTELVNKIKEAEAEKNKRALKRLEKDLSYVKNLIEAFKKYLHQLEEPKTATAQPSMVVELELEQQKSQQQKKPVAVST